MELSEIKGETSKIREHVQKYLVGNGLDIGCGPDPITKFCDAFDQTMYPGVTHVGDAAHLPFEDGAYDWIFSSHALEDFEKTDETLVEWLRVLKTGGVVILYVPNQFLYKGFNANHRHDGWTPSELAAILVSLRCEIVETMIDDVPTESHPHHSSLVVGRKL